MQKKPITVVGVVVLSVFVTFSKFSLAFEALPAAPPIPDRNKMTDAKIELGKQLFFDGRLSKDGKVSCNTCHNAQGSGTDNLPFSKGVGGQLGGRNSPTVLNSGFWSVQFWDGRAPTLEEQAKGPLLNPVEMAMKDHDQVVKVVSGIKGYQNSFKEVFGVGPTEINVDHIADSIAAFERTLVTPNAPYDKFVNGDEKAISASAKRGLELVKTVGCVACHNGPLFNSPAYMRFPTIPGSNYDKKYGFSKDLGRFNVTQKEEDKNFWRVPSLRNVAVTAPYFHNGSVKTLNEAVKVMAKTQLGKDLKNNEAADITEFLKTLTGDKPKFQPPKLPL
jgi:cytochrome c peroxidase